MYCISIMRWYNKEANQQVNHTTIVSETLRKYRGNVFLRQKSFFHLPWVICLDVPVHGYTLLAAHGTRLSEGLVVVDPPHVHLHVAVVLGLEAAQPTLDSGLIMNIADVLL